MKGDVSKGEIDTNRVRCGANQCVDKVTRKLKYEAKIVEEVSVRAAFEDLDKQAKNGDFSAYELVEILLRFSKLIDVLAQRR